MKLENVLKDSSAIELEATSPEDYPNQEDKIAKAADWRHKGVSVKVIAEFFGVSQRTIYTWLKKSRDLYAEEYEQKTASDLIIEHQEFLEYLEKHLLFEMHHIGKDTLEFDPKTKKAVKVKGAVRDKRDLAALILQVRKQKIDLEVTTGIIPRQPERIHSSISDFRFDDADVEQEEIKDLSEEQIHQLFDRMKRSIEL